MSEVELLMKRCQRGVGGFGALNEAHDIMAECYGMLGKLESERDAALAECDRLRTALEFIAKLHIIPPYMTPQASQLILVKGHADAALSAKP